MLQLGIINFTKGAYITVEGKAEADKFYIIQQGKVRIKKETEIVAEEGGNLLGPGDFIGVVSCLSGHSQIETAIAETNVTIITVRKDQYPSLIKDNTPVAMKIILLFSRRMRYLDEALARIALKKTAENDSSHIFNVGEFYVRQGKYNIAMYAYYQYLKANPGGRFARRAKERFLMLRKVAKPVYLEPKTTEMARFYPRDMMIFSEAQPGSELYIIQKGQVKISKVVDNNEVLLAVLNPGDIFGEMALLENKPRSASAIAYEDCTILVVNRANFEQMVHSQPQLISRLTVTLSDRIWLMYKQLANTLISDIQGKMYDMMCLQLEKNRIPFNNNSYIFPFGPRELATMCGIPTEKQEEAVRTLLQNKKIQLNEKKLQVSSTAELLSQATFYKKKQMIESSRLAGRKTITW